MPKLYGIYRSRASRVFWLANELGLTLDHVPVTQHYQVTNPEAPGAPLNTRSAEFLALSPAGTIPLLVDGDLVLSESMAISLHLARRQGGPLAPADAAELALMEQWALYAVASVEPAALAIQYAHADGSTATPEGRAGIAAHAETLQRPLKVIDGHLATHGHLVGGRFTVADLNMAEVLRYSQAHPTLLQAFPALNGWLAACQARPAFKAMWAARAAEV